MVIQIFLKEKLRYININIGKEINILFLFSLFQRGPYLRTSFEDFIYWLIIKWGKIRVKQGNFLDF